MPSLVRAADRELKLAVVLTRHGVRAPTSTGPSSGPAWPNLHDWNVPCDGYLTDRGAKLLRLLGVYYDQYFTAKGLLPPSACPAPYVDLWADSDERTIKTAEAIRDGMAQAFTRCDIKVGWYHPPAPPPPPKPSPAGCPTPPVDALFHPLGAHLHALDTDAINSILTSLQKRNQELLARYKRPLSALQETLDCDPIHFGAVIPCSPLLKIAPSYEIGSGDSPVKWGGPINDGSTAAETFLLEYADGMPCHPTGPQTGRQTGWGHVGFRNPDCSTGHSFPDMETIHTLYFDLTQRASYPAKINGSNLVDYILGKMQDRVAGGVKGSDVAAKRLIFLAGHDTNVANVSGMLGMSWKLPDLPPNDTPPGGAIVFELYGTDNPRDWSVKIRYVHQTVEQLRGETVLSFDEPPNWVDLTVPGCPWVGICPFEQFQKAARKAIDPNFVSKNPVGQ